MNSSGAKFINPSNPNPQTGSHRYPRNNKYVFGFNNKNKRNTVSQGKKSESNTRRKDSIPFPFLSSFLGLSDHYKPGKKLNFANKPTSNQIHQDQMEQINQKKMEIKTFKTLDQGEDKRYLQKFLKTVKREDHQKVTLHKNLTKEMQTFNDCKVIDNVNWDKYVQNKKQNECYNFFPFTHGENVEVDREKKKQKARRDMQRKIKNGSRQRARQKMSQSFYNPSSPL